MDPAGEEGLEVGLRAGAASGIRSGDGEGRCGIRGTHRASIHASVTGRRTREGAAWPTPGRTGCGTAHATSTTAILEHPFLAGLTDGTLPEPRFVHYVAQDAAYLRDYARALSVIAAKAPSHADTAMLSNHAADTADVELALHETLAARPRARPRARRRGPGLADDPRLHVLPARDAPRRHVRRGPGGRAALLLDLPAGRRGAVEQGSPDPRYQRWIDTYGGDEFATTVDEVLELADRVGPDLPAAEAWRTREHFRTTARYEWMFWDAAWREETWPI